MSQQTLRNVPSIVFSQGKENTAIVVIDWLRQLLILDLLIKKMTLYKMISGNLRLVSPLWSDSMESALLSNLCRINQQALNSHMMEYKKEEREKTWKLSPVCPTQEQGELTKLMTQMKKRKKKAKFLVDDDISSKNCLLGRISKDDLDDDSVLFWSARTRIWIWITRSRKEFGGWERRWQKGIKFTCFKMQRKYICEASALLIHSLWGVKLIQTNCCHGSLYYVLCLYMNSALKKEK